MKNIIYTCLAAALISPLCAGGAAPSIAATPSNDSYCWFLGGGGDYMFDSEEVLWNAHLGYNLSDASSIFLEVGWMGEDEDVSVLGIDVGVDIDIVPVTLNYKYEWALGDKLSWYLGVGLGAAMISIDVDGFGSADESTFMAQGFTGMVYEFTPAFEGYFGFRYMWFDEPDFGDDGDLESFDDYGVGLGLRVNF